MFFKYISYNLKKHALSYLMILLCGMISLCIMLCGSGIMLDSVASRQSYNRNETSVFTFNFSSAMPAETLEEKVEQFQAKLPYRFNRINLNLTGKQSEEYFYDVYHLYLFYDYETLASWMYDTFGTDRSQLPTYDEFVNKDKVVIVGGRLPMGTYDIAALEHVDENGYLDMMGEKYKVSGYYDGTGMYMLWGTQPKGTLIRGMVVRMEKPVTERQTEEIMEIYKEIFGDIPLSSQEIPELYGLLELRANTANIVISAVIMLISIFNILLVFKYMLSSRKRGFAVFRFCGFGKAGCAWYCGVEFMTLSAISSALGCLVFDKLIRAGLAEYYITFEFMFTLDYYAILIAAYLGISLIMFLAYIVPSLTRSVTAELRGI